MTTYWVPRYIENPNLVEDIKKYFPQAISDNIVDQLLNSNNKGQIVAIVDKLEFIDQLLQMSELFNEKKERTEIRKEELDNQGSVKITVIEKIRIGKSEFTGFPYDVEALSQYLLIGVIEMLVEGYGTSKTNNFVVAFATLSPDIKNRLIKTFLIVEKVGAGKIDGGDLTDWNQNTNDAKISEIARFLYKKIRCNYTHEAGRTFLPVLPIEYSLGINKKTLVSMVPPHEDNLICILKDIVKELLVVKFPV